MGSDTVETIAAAAGIATAAGTAALAVATLVLARRTAAQARTSAAALAAQVRPLLIDVPLSGAGDDEAPLYPGGERGAKWRPGHAEVSFDAGRGFVSVPLRNAGPGPAKVTGARLAISHAPELLDLWMATRQFVPAGEVVRVSLLLGDGARHLQGAFADAAVRRGSGLTLELDYADVSGELTTTSTFALARRLDEGWIVTGIEHRPPSVAIPTRRWLRRRQS